MGARGALAALGLATGILLTGWWTGSAVAAPARYQGSLDSMVSYLQNDQNPDGGLGSEPGADSDDDVSAWAALAFAAAGINPRDQTPADQHYIGGHSLYGYLTEQADTLSSTTDFERELLVVDATGTSPTDFGGVNLLEKILDRQLAQPGSTDGAFVHEAGSGEPAMNDTIFAILALSPIREPRVEAVVRTAAEWVEREQDCDHGWPSTAYRIGGACPAGGSLPGEPQSEVDMTAAAIQALNAAGRQGAANEIERHAFEYLKTAQDAKGGFSEEPGNPEPNVASTAWVVQAMWSAGINPETWVTHSGLASEEPLGYMASLQQGDGHIRWEQSQEWHGVWMTAFVGTAMAGDTFLPSPPPYVELPLAPTETSGNAQRDESSKSGRGVIAGGGGGNGAPLFSRPQSGSKGHTPGGARELERPKHATDTHSPPRRNPGPTHRRTTPTVSGPDRTRSSVSHVGSIAVEEEDARRGPGAGTHHALGARSSRESHGGLSGSANGGTASGSGTDGTGKGGGPLLGATSAAVDAAGSEVTGVLLGEPGSSDIGKGSEAEAPGLLGAGAGGNEARWPTIATAALIALLILTGALLERRRPHTTL